MLNGTPFSPNHPINSISIFCGLCRESTSTNKLVICLRFSTYDSIIFRNSSRASLLRCAYPYPGKSTIYHSLFIRKWLISIVLPGVAEVFARFFLSVSILINEDLPTFDRPMNAYSGILPSGHFRTSLLLIMNFASLITILFQEFIQKYNKFAEP